MFARRRYKETIAAIAAHAGQRMLLMLVTISIDKWFKDNRQWSCLRNREHARFMIENVHTAKERAFWQLILERLEG